jgi:DNA-binding XRE family transcriptional regulator
MIGLTRQSINNIESGRHRLSQTQYLAILCVLEKQIFPKLDAEQKINIEKLLTDKVANRNYFDSLIF